MHVTVTNTGKLLDMLIYETKTHDQGFIVIYMFSL